MGDDYKPTDETMTATTSGGARSTSIDEYENRFHEIDASLDALRSSLKEDDDDDNVNAAGSKDSTDDTHSIASSLLARDGEMDSSWSISPSIVDRTPAQETATKKSSSPTFTILAILIPIILAFSAGKKLSPSIGTPLAISRTDDGSDGPTINYQERRKVEKCRYAHGERHCESDEQSVSSSSSSGGTISASGQRVFHHATFQKCRSVNGQSYCESYQQELSSSGDDDEQSTAAPARIQLLASEFRAADVNQDGQVSRSEFDRYKEAYVQQYPDMKGNFAKFEDFDSDSNGFISVNEHEEYYRALGLL